MTDTALPTSAFATFEPLAPEDYDALDLILDDLRSRSDETPQWEFCEGFLAALVCCRRSIPAADYRSVLLDLADDSDTEETHGSGFADAAQRERFMDLWLRRWHEVVTGLI